LTLPPHSHLVTRVAILSDPERGIAVMAGAAGFAVFHIFHGRPVGTTFRLKQIGVAFIATEHVDVSGMRKHHITVILVLVEDIAGMAGRTVASHAKRSITVMAGAARLTLGHRIHGRMVAVVPRLEEVGMALFAAVHVDMNSVTEHGNTDTLGLDRNITGVTGDTVAGHTEGLSPVMTSAAGSALLHQFHGDMVAVILLFEDARVADITLKSMSTMAEDDCADVFGLDREFVYHPSDTSHAPQTSHTYSMKNRDRRTNQQQEDY